MSTPQEPNQANPTPLPSVILILQELEDPRVERTRKHHLGELLRILELSGCIITCDAMGCQKNIAKAVRGHWGVENSCHWVLDVIFKEDESRARSGHAAQNLGTARGLAMNLIRKEPTHRRGIKGRVKRAGWDNGYLEKILAN